MYILGVSCWYHDAASALLRNGEVVAASEEERFTRIKHDYEFPINSINFCLEKAGIQPQDIDYIVFYDKPFIKFERILTSIINHIPRSLAVFREAVPIWLKEKLHFHNKIKKLLRIKPDKVLFCNHHLSHAASAFYLSPFEESTIITIDGVGEWATATIGFGKENKINILYEMHFPHSIGLLYSTFTAFLGFRVNNGEYKVMGMAPYGKPKYVDKIKKIVTINNDGSIELNLDYFSFPYSTKKAFTDKFIQIFGEPRKLESFFFTKDSDFPAYYGDKPRDFEKSAIENQYYADIAASIQKVLEEIIVKLANYAYSITGCKNICYAGGVALNSKANYYLQKDTPFEEIFIQPAATDAGGALGAALWCWHEVLGNKNKKIMESAYLGKSFSQNEIKKAILKSGLKYRELNEDRLINITVENLINNKVVGWYQGRTELGPRALGNRSILANSTNKEMKNIVNIKVKLREPFRPFAPSVLSEDIFSYFEVNKEIYPQRFMLVTYPVKKEYKDKIEAVIHVDGTSRIQSVYSDHNPLYYNLIKKFKENTGIGCILNTSFNLKGEPIVNSPWDAINTFMKSGIDILILGNFLVEKNG